MTTHFIRPDVQAYLDAMKANPRPPMNDATIAMMRQIPKEVMTEMLGSLDQPVGELGEDRRVTMPGPQGDIELRLFDARASRGPGPVVVFYHGGGFVVGSIDTHAGMAAEISRGLDLPVVSVEYRLAPEAPWPAAPDDCEAAARWIAENGAEFGREFTHLILCGDSAGATLTLVTTLALRDKAAALPVAMQWPIYPRADGSRKYASAETFGSGFGLDATDMAYFEKAYACDDAHWRGSPYRADQAGLPPTFVVTAGLDPLRDNGRAYAAKCIEAGVDVTYREVPGTIHGFACFRKAIPSAQGDFAGLLAIAKAMIEASI
ncbi:MAG: alpha/beta hydrolase [Novosphingobium sp.]